MPPTTIRSFAGIMENPRVTKRDTLTITRRVLRIICQRRREILD
ncbi:hypothetical protein [Pseudomonas sp. GWSMS-1]